MLQNASYLPGSSPSIGRQEISSPRLVDVSMPGGITTTSFGAFQWSAQWCIAGDGASASGIRRLWKKVEHGEAFVGVHMFAAFSAPTRMESQESGHHYCHPLLRALGKSSLMAVSLA